MNCSWCHQDTNQFDWFETSNLGRRPICHNCIGYNDLRRMKEVGSIILKRDGNYLHNQCGSVRWKIKQQIIKDDGTTTFVFLNNKHRWTGIQYAGCGRVMCRRA